MIETTEIFASSFNHCSTVCPHQDGVLIAWYSGINECHDDQSVYLIFINQNNRSDIVRIGDKTGNPILWKSGGEIFILWSKFEDDGVINRLADRWKYCSLWVQKIEIQDKPILVGKPTCVMGSANNLLGRCPAIHYKGKVLLPLYDEVEGTCVIVDDSNFTELSKFGSDIIQPTIWTKYNKLHSLGRNFRTHRNKAQHTQSSDGVIWQQPIDTDIFNVNNSLCVVNWRNSEAIVWNDTTSRYRDKLTLGLLKNYNCLEVIPVSVIGERYGAYPFCAVDGDRIHITFTNIRKRIEYHVWKWEDITEACRRNLVRTSNNRQRNQTRTIHSKRTEIL